MDAPEPRKPKKAKDTKSNKASVKVQRIIPTKTGDAWRLYNLPLAGKLNVFKYLDIKSILALHHTCHAWEVHIRNLVRKSDPFCKQRIKKDFPETYAAVSQATQFFKAAYEQVEGFTDDLSIISWKEVYKRRTYSHKVEFELDLTYAAGTAAKSMQWSDLPEFDGLGPEEGYNPNTEVNKNQRSAYVSKYTQYYLKYSDLAAKYLALAMLLHSPSEDLHSNVQLIIDGLLVSYNTNYVGRLREFIVWAAKYDQTDMVIALLNRYQTSPNTSVTYFDRDDPIQGQRALAFRYAAKYRNLALARKLYEGLVIVETQKEEENPITGKDKPYALIPTLLQHVFKRTADDINVVYKRLGSKAGKEHTITGLQPFLKTTPLKELYQCLAFIAGSDKHHSPLLVDILLGTIEEKEAKQIRKGYLPSIAWDVKANESQANEVNKPCSIGRLPAELIVYILSYLRTKDLLHALHTHQYWYRIILGEKHLACRNDGVTTLLREWLIHRLLKLAIVLPNREKLIATLAKMGLRLNMPDPWGRTVLHTAAQHQPKSIRTLIRNGATSYPDVDGVLPVELLIQRGIDVENDDEKKIKNPGLASLAVNTVFNGFRLEDVIHDKKTLNYVATITARSKIGYRKNKKSLPHMAALNNDFHLVRAIARHILGNGIPLWLRSTVDFQHYSNLQYYSKHFFHPITVGNRQKMNPLEIALANKHTDPKICEWIFLMGNADRGFEFSIISKPEQPIIPTRHLFSAFKTGSPHVLRQHLKNFEGQVNFSKVEQNGTSLIEHTIQLLDTEKLLVLAEHVNIQNKRTSSHELNRFLSPGRLVRLQERAAKKNEEEDTLTLDMTKNSFQFVSDITRAMKDPKSSGYTEEYAANLCLQICKQCNFGMVSPDRDNADEISNRLWRRLLLNAVSNARTFYQLQYNRKGEAGKKLLETLNATQSTEDCLFELNKFLKFEKGNKNLNQFKEVLTKVLGNELNLEKKYHHLSTERLVFNIGDGLGHFYNDNVSNGQPFEDIQNDKEAEEESSSKKSSKFSLFK